MTEMAVFGGGCFWCTETVFAGLRGVHEVLPGYCGGHVDNPSYEQVCSKTTGHIEVVRIEFDPQQVSYDTLLDVFFHTHDPCTPDRQGGDVGPQYASAIFVQSEAQRQAARAAIDRLQPDFPAPIVTHVLEAQRFWEAESYHRNYYARNPEQGYCQVVINPKVSKFRQKYAALLA